MRHLGLDRAICQVVPTVPSESSEHEPKDDLSCSSECDMDFHIDGDNGCNDTGESALEDDDKNDLVNNNIIIAK